jgi:hypothetical protein
VEKDELLNPVDVGFFRPQAVMPYPNRCSDLIKQFGFMAY